MNFESEQSDDLDLMELDEEAYAEVMRKQKMVMKYMQGGGLEKMRLAICNSSLPSDFVGVILSPRT